MKSNKFLRTTGIILDCTYSDHIDRPVPNSRAAIGKHNSR